MVVIGWLEALILIWPNMNSVSWLKWYSDVSSVVYIVMIIGMAKQQETNRYTARVVKSQPDTGLL